MNRNCRTSHPSRGAVGVAVLGFSLLATATATAAPSGDVNTVQFDITEAGLGLFGVQFTTDYLIPVEDIEDRMIVGTRFHLEFNTNHEFGDLPDAADIQLEVQPPIENIENILQVSGADLGWSGQGTFTADFETDFFDGEPVLDFPEGTEFGLLFFRIISLNDDDPALGGQFTNSYFQLDFAPIPAPPTLAMLSLAFAVGRRRRRG
jgi:uncharacterized protein (TIGR03382 family)